MKDVKQSNGHIVPTRHRKRTCKQKRLLRLGCTALALTLVMVTGIMTGILPGIGMTAYASPAAYTITWEYETFRTLPSGGTQNGITFSGDKSDYSTNVYSSQITFTAPEGSVFTKIEFPTTATNITSNSANTGTFSVVDYSFYSTKDRRDVDGKMVTWTGESSTISFTKYAYAIEYITFTLYDEPPHEHTWEWVTDIEPNCGQPGEMHEKCTVCGATQSVGTVIEPTGAHTWEWVTDAEPTETHPGEKHEKCTVCGAKQNEHTVIPARGTDNYAFTDVSAFTDDSAFTWTKGSSDGLKMEIRNTSGNDADTFDKFLDVYVDEIRLTRNTDYTADNGCIVLTLFPDYLQNLSPGEHILRVKLTDADVKHTFTVADLASTDTSASTDTPDTGESIALVVCCAVLMLLAAGGCTFVFLRRRKAQA